MKKNLYLGNIDCPLDKVNGTKLNIHHLGKRQFERYFSDNDILNLSIVYSPLCPSDCIADFCHRAHLAPLLEQGCGIGPAKDRSHPADIIIVCVCVDF